ncbi:transketolase C-terminal domain-containing protein [Streptomyces vietnamensis]|uniref:transketolase C-terminal domain-containing protein n=1 Tax=Streptomyces vietnamensis TaxID=362257 RepID=UPI0006991882|nr:transketolase C-terminal domain-containing protein [Streptomyces vietnamensis]
MNLPLSRVPLAEFDRVRTGIEDPYERTRAFSALCRINTLYMVMRAGSGHLGSSFSAADVVSHLLLNEMTDPCTDDGDVYFSSKGHDAPGLYSALIGFGALPEDLVHRLRRIDGLPGHPDVHTPFMPFNTGSLGMGISKAKGLILADRQLGRRRRMYVMTGDGELQEGQNWEALGSTAHHAMGELTVIVDHNKIQSDTWVADVNDLGDLIAKFEAFGWGALRVDGHDQQALEAAFRKRAEAFPDRPVVIVADTVKGGGCATFAATSMPADEWMYQYHSGAPSDEDHRSAHAELVTAADEILRRAGLDPLRLVQEAPRVPPAPPSLRLFQAYGEELAAQAEQRTDIVALDADLVLDTGLIPFSERHPDRFFEFGIAEQDMVSAAGGMAAGGLLPFVHSFSCFLHSRPNEQIYNNATEGRKVVYAGALAGLLPAQPGHSHQAVRDVSAIGAMPGTVVLQPANAAGARAAVRYCLDTPHSVYLRIASVAVPAEVDALGAEELRTGVGRIVRAGGRTVAVGAGPVVLGQLLRAAQLLEADGIDLTVVELPWLNRVDADWLTALAAGADQLIVVEDHYVKGGQADRIARTLLEIAPAASPSFRGVGLTEVPRCGTDEEALKAHGLHAEQLARTIRAEAAGTGTPGPLDLASRGASRRV